MRRRELFGSAEVGVALKMDKLTCCGEVNNFEERLKSIKVSEEKGGWIGWHSRLEMWKHAMSHHSKF